MTIPDTSLPSTAVPQLGKLATLGYRQPEAWQLVRHMVSKEQDWSLVDIRHYPYSSLGEWSRDALRRQFGYRYLVVSEFGNLHYLEPSRPVQLANPEAGLAKVGGFLQAGLNCLLLCGCPDWQRCHRKEVTALLQEAYPQLEVCHLLPDPQAVEFPLLLHEVVALLERRGLLMEPLCAPGEQPVLVRTIKGQPLFAPHHGSCVASLSLTLWLPPSKRSQQLETVPVVQEHDEPLPVTVAPKATEERNVQR